MTQLLINVPDTPALDAGEVADEDDGFLITPPGQPMIDQLVERLDGMPHEYIGIQTQHLGVGLTALCVRWGTYLATLLDASAPLHPDLAPDVKQQPGQYSFITDGEMKRMNIEVSYNLCRMAQLYRERGTSGLDDILSKAYVHLPMPQRAVRMDRELGASLVGAVAQSRLTSSDRPVRPVLIEHADRAIANVLAVWGWRNTEIEDIHAGKAPCHPLRPHQRRMRPREASRLMREVSSKFASHYFWFETYFGVDPASGELPRWPEPATALANSFPGAWASSWSLTEISATIRLPG